LPNTTDELVLADDFTDIPEPEGRIVAGFDVGRTLDRSELAVFEETSGRFTCRLLRTYAEARLAEQEADLRRLLEVLPVGRLSIDRSGIRMNLAENLARDFPQVVPENFTNKAKDRWATDSMIALQRREVSLPRNRDLVAQVHSIKKQMLASGKVAFDAERTSRGGHADRFWAIAIACQRERERVGGRGVAGMEIGVRILG
jgi:phage FluMu gp28-like protein